MREYWLDPPEGKSPPVCPVCGEPCETVYTDVNSEVCGCDNCVLSYDAGEYFDDDDGPDPDEGYERRFDYD